jgi:hypothetical protein
LDTVIYLVTVTSDSWITTHAHTKPSNISEEGKVALTRYSRNDLALLLQDLAPPEQSLHTKNSRKSSHTFRDEYMIYKHQEYYEQIQLEWHAGKKQQQFQN